MRGRHPSRRTSPEHFKGKPLWVGRPSFLSDQHECWIWLSARPCWWSNVPGRPSTDSLNLLVTMPADPQHDPERRQLLLPIPIKPKISRHKATLTTTTVSMHRQ